MDERQAQSQDLTREAAAERTAARWRDGLAEWDQDGARIGRLKSAVAFSMHPVSVADLMQISDSGGIMPPKSTWFEPKLRDGLLSHVI